MTFRNYLDLAPDQPGPPVRVNHEGQGCKGSSRSLSIWRNSDGSVGMKCFRCGEGARIKDKPSLFRKKPNTKAVTYDIPEDIVYEWAKMPVQATAYLSKHKFTEKETGWYGIGWSDSEERLVIPSTNLSVEAPGWSGKSFTKEPRYLTRTKYPDYMYTHLDKGTKQVIITEDALSAIRSRAVLSSFALHGTGLTDNMMSELRRYHEFFLWLDNDNVHVKKAQIKVHNTLSLYGKAWLIKQDKEPKECTPDEIREVLIKVTNEPHRKF